VHVRSHNNVDAERRRHPRHSIGGGPAQLRRAAVSVPSNIAEGHTRVGTKEYLHHLAKARASLAELETQLEISARLSYISAEARHAALQPLTTLSRQLHALRQSLLRRQEK